MASAGKGGRRTGSKAGLYVRRGLHGGSWYSSDPRTLHNQLETWLQTAPCQVTAPTRALIAPHAGYSYSGPAASHAYTHLRAAAASRKIERIFVLGPSHHVHLRGCAVSGASECLTPIGTLHVDQGICDELLSTGLFELMSMGMDEDEHSIEMHLPYIARAMGVSETSAADGQAPAFTIIPIMVGSLNEDSQAQYGHVLAPYLDDPANFFVVSSDFCHWGSRFRYQPYDNRTYGRNLAIWEWIEAMDREGISCIEQQDHSQFSTYLKRSQNTICGRYPISVFLYALAVARTDFDVRFVAYEQSSKVTSKADSSVSYASAVISESPANAAGEVST